MKAVYYESFQGKVSVEQLPDPSARENQVVIDVKATGLCRSDWHGWMGHDPDIALPHVPGHELAGVVAEVGSGIKNWKVGDRVTVPFVSGCGHCEHCHSGNQQVCDHQFQPGFTAWGSFAEYVAIDYADLNLARLPDSMHFNTAASLGCRFITSFRAVVDVGQVRGGEWVAVFGCGGVGLSAVMIAAAMGAQVIAVDIHQDKLDLARALGATETVLAQPSDEVVTAIQSITEGGAHMALDALGSRDTCYQSIACLRTRGRQVQVGLMAGKDADPPIPMHLVVGKELQILGSHGMQAHRYPAIFELVKNGRLQPKRLIGSTISLEEAAEKLPLMNQFQGNGVTIIDRF